MKNRTLQFLIVVVLLFVVGVETTRFLDGFIEIAEAPAGTDPMAHTLGNIDQTSFIGIMGEVRLDRPSLVNIVTEGDVSVVIELHSSQPFSVATETATFEATLNDGGTYWLDEINERTFDVIPTSSDVTMIIDPEKMAVIHIRIWQ